MTPRVRAVVIVVLAVSALLAPAAAEARDLLPPRGDGPGDWDPSRYGQYTPGRVCWP